ncbi:MAG: glycosyltransferase family 4 protein [Planctomycetota bacterium]
MSDKKIVFISKGEHSASTRYRALDYFPYLREAGWTPEHLPAGGNSLARLTILRRAAQADAVVVLRKAFPAFYVRLLRKAARRLIFDFDDAIFLHSNGRPSPRRARRFGRIVRACDQVWAGNSYLAAEARRHNVNVTVLPTSIVTEKYAVSAAQPPDTVDLVWIGSRSTRHYLVEVMPLLEDLAEELPGLRLKIVADFVLPGSRLVVVPVPWREQTEALEIASAHIGIAPMPDNPWTRGKCGLKVLQYMAAGVPAVASLAGVHRDIIQHGVSGFLVTSVEEWRAALRRLIGDASLRQQIGAAGKRRAAERFSLAATFASMQSQL